MLAGIGAFVALRLVARAGCGCWRSACGALAFGALGVAIGVLAREVRAASLLALPALAAAGLPGARARGSVAGGLYDVISVVSFVFPFKAALQALDAAVNDASPGVWRLARAPRRAGRAASARSRAWACGACADCDAPRLLTSEERWPFPRRACAGCAQRRAARARARDRAARRPARAAAVRHRGPPAPDASRSRRCRASSACRSPAPSTRPARRPRSGIAGVMLFGIPAAQGRRGLGRLGRGGRGPARGARDQAGLARAAGAHRRVPVRVHRPRPLRRRCGDGRRRSTTTRRSSCSPASRSATPAPAPTSSRPRT